MVPPINRFLKWPLRECQFHMLEWTLRRLGSQLSLHGGRCAVATLAAFERRRALAEAAGPLQVDPGSDWELQRFSMVSIVFLLSLTFQAILKGKSQLLVGLWNTIFARQITFGELANRKSICQVWFWLILYIYLIYLSLSYVIYSIQYIECIQSI